MGGILRGDPELVEVELGALPGRGGRAGAPGGPDEGSGPAGPPSGGPEWSPRGGGGRSSGGRRTGGGCCGLRAYLERTSGAFGWRFLAMITSAHLAVKGFLYQAVQTAALPYFMDYLGCSPMEYQAMIIIVWTPWAMKGVIGIFSDLFPILGYHKRPYIAASAILGTAVLLLLAALPLARAGPAVAPFAALLMALCMLEQALVDLLVEGKYAEKMAERPETGPDLVTWVWANYQTGVLLAAALVGTLADAVGPRAMYAVASVFALQVVFPALKGYLPEERLPRGRRGPRWALAREHRGTFLLALAMSASAVGLSVLSLYGSNVVRLAYGLVTAAALNAGAFLVLPRAMAKANVYMFFTQCTYVLLTGALDYFYTGKTAEQCAASATCRCYVREGPHFSATYYLTVAQVLAAVAGWLGVTAYQSLLSSWRFRPVFWVTTVIRCIGAGFDLVMIQRLNLRVGIPDKIFYILGSTIIYNVVYMLEFMPAVVLTSRLCPKKVETVSYAILGGFQNYGQQVSRALGLVVTETYGVGEDAGDGSCDFSRLSWLVVAGHMVLPLVMVPLTFLLIPDAAQTEDLQHLVGGAPKAMRLDSGDLSGEFELKEGRAGGEEEDIGLLGSGAPGASPHMD